LIDSEDVGLRLAAARAALAKAQGKARIGQERAAAAVGVVRSTLLNYENGTHLPNVGTLDTLAEYYGIPLEWFIGVEPREESDRLVMARSELAKIQRTTTQKTPAKESARPRK
jgi:transcriptional regulator with XRE-family HTH domain